MASRWKYDLIIKGPEDDNKQYIFKDFNLYEIDEFCSSYDNEVSCIIELSKKMKIAPKSKLTIVDYKGFQYQPIFGNEVLKNASTNIYRGLDSYGKDRLKINVTDKSNDIILEFLKIMDSKDGEEFSETKSASSCITKSIMMLTKRFLYLNNKNNQHTLESVEELEEMQEIMQKLRSEFYIYKNFRGIIVFIERFNKGKKYKKRNAETNNQREEIVPIRKDYNPVIDWQEEADKYNKSFVEKYDTEEYLDADEYEMMVNSENVDSDKQYQRRIR